MKDAHLPRNHGSVIFNLYQQQLKKINAVLAKLPEDIQGDYQREVDYISR